MAGADISLPLAISSGDPAGVGPEIIGKAWEARKKQKLKSFLCHWRYCQFRPSLGWTGRKDRQSGSSSRAV
jgi:4-hydroxythreonine-4-phosphate dehydrogenase